MKHIFGDSGALQFSERPLLKVSFTLNPYPLGVSTQQVHNLIGNSLSDTFAMAAAPSQELFTWLSGKKPLFFQRQVDTGDFVGALITDWDPGTGEFLWFSVADDTAPPLTYKHNPIAIIITNETQMDYGQAAFDDIPWSVLKPMPWSWACLFLNGVVTAAHERIVNDVSVERVTRVHTLGGDISSWFSEEMLAKVSARFTMGDTSYYKLGLSLLQRLTQQYKWEPVKA